MKLEVKDVDKVMAVFPGRVIGALLPKWEDIPKEFKDDHTKWNKIVHLWFFEGLPKETVWKPKEGVDKAMALRMVGTCMRSFEPQHEHKTAGCAWMLSEFFEDIVIPDRKEK